jgi:hypothetical protein
VECQLDIIEKRGRSPAIIKEALAHLPAKLDSVYSRILQQIDKSDWQDVHRILTWLVASKIPLDADTLSFVPTIDPGEQSVDLNRRLLRPQHDILELCGSLVKTTAGKFGRQIIVLAHYSVAEYLTRLSFDDGTSLSCFAIRMQDADSHICAASIVLFQWLEAQGLESENKRSEARRSMKRILDYCLEHWWKHASSQVQIERMDLIRSLLRDRRGWCLHLDAKIHISLKMSPTGYYCQSSKHNFARARGIERHCGCPEIELYIATVLGLCEVVAASIADGAELSASVFIAAIKGQHRDVVELLLKNQIDPNFSVACRTPLTVAINATLTPTQTSKDIIELLLRYGANPNCPPSTNPLARQYGMWEEPLNFAGISRNTGVINLLLAYGAKIQSPTFRWGRGHGKFSDCCVAAGKWCGCDRPYFTSEWCGLGTTAYERPKCLRDTKQWRMSEC